MDAKPKLFTIDEANAALETIIKPALERIDDDLQRLERGERERAVMGLIIDSGASESNPDRESLERLAGRMKAVRAEIREDIEAILATGALVKDLEKGLIDFFAVIDGQLVFLCWQRSEEQILYWHPIDEGFRGRRRLSERTRRLGDG